ncbi:F167A-like protein [Mya arenaria]|uniref:F167A-like protein n=1 Tax=Mya arenaria TaxID=6604 RepID=A0ABY7F5Y8_MYAAR|nr:uncharacterized protein LOC128206352 [Mya arenaria]XP_052765048.1 uncharacterized protein LOC128206539 [Mya arenaria]WAR16140.1 F167A-like protein [Mya arenaria]WAR16219.1 F167A-like protein [Mya arenaria]
METDYVETIRRLLARIKVRRRSTVQMLAARHSSRRPSSDVFLSPTSLTALTERRTSREKSTGSCSRWSGESQVFTDDISNKFPCNQELTTQNKLRKYSLSRAPPNSPLTSNEQPSAVKKSVSDAQFVFGKDYHCHSSTDLQSCSSEAWPPTPPPTICISPATEDINDKGDKSPRKKLSSSLSAPLSPRPASDEQRTKVCQDMQMKLDVIKADLLAMQKGDQDLAKKLLCIYSEIQAIKTSRSCFKYSELLGDAFYEAEDAEELSNMCDAAPISTNKLLVSRGVTNFNISPRRFSCF